MKKLFYFAVFLANIVSAQIGIGNTSPQKALHISGAKSTTPIAGTSVEIVKPTVRIDGLNNSNQSIAAKLRPVSVSDKGDLVLAPNLVKNLIMIDSFNPANSETDYLPSPITTNQTSTALTTNLSLRNFDFVLNTPSLVRIGAVTSFRFYRADNGNPISDDSNRLWGTRFRFVSAPSGISTASTAYFGESLKGYYSRLSNASATQIHYANSEDVLFLPAGSYTIEIIATAITATGQVPLRIVNGNGDDTFSVTAYSVQ